MSEINPVVIVGIARTAFGSLRGALASKSASELGATVIAAAVERAGLSPTDVDEVLMGCVLSAGQGQAPARQAALRGGLLESVGCSTINKMCGSGMKAVMIGFDALHAEPGRIIVEGGMESMSNAPHLLPKARNGAQLGHAEVIDHMLLDGLEDAYDRGRPMGTFAEDAATHFGFGRGDQDAFAIESLTRAAQAIECGLFEAEIAAVEVTGARGPIVIRRDEHPQTVTISRISRLKPAFRDGGTVTAASSSQISDGAAALVLMRETVATQRGLKLRAKIVGVATHAHAPAWFTTAPIGALRKLSDGILWPLNQVDLFEINEAFAVIPMVAMRELELPHHKVNVHGGACALGHPIGASGARIVVSLLNAMEQRHAKRGMAAICIGGGEATAIAIERMQ